MLNQRHRDRSRKYAVEKRGKKIPDGKPLEMSLSEPRGAGRKRAQLLLSRQEYMARALAALGVFGPGTGFLRR